MSQQRLTDEQVKRIEIALKESKTNNPFARALSNAMAKHEGVEGKRQVIASSYAALYEVMLLVQLGLDSSLEPKEVERRLQSAKN